MNEKLSKREKVMLGVGFVGVCAAGYFGYRYGVYQTGNKSSDKINSLETKVKILQEAASEGLYEEAIATVTRKINHLKDQIEYCTSNLSINPNDFQAKASLNAYKAKLEILTSRKDNFLKAQKAYGLFVE